jgi:23S rRNA pseudouridine2605 synthase
MCGISSRRKAEELVLEGKVKVNQKIVTDLATRVKLHGDHVTVNGKPVSPDEEFVYIVLNKPRDTITTMSDEKGRHTVMELVKSRHRVYPVGRLDRNTTGVLLLTNDGDLAHRLMHPKHEFPKSYRVTLDRPAQPEHLDRLARGIRLEDGMAAPSEVLVLPGTKAKDIGVVIREGRNREVRRMFEFFGYEVMKLDRVAYGPVTKEGLGRGESRSLTRGELRQLRSLVGLEDEPRRETTKRDRKE